MLDAWCQVHGLDNLWSVDAGCFPSSAAVNPSLTIAAQALRVAPRIAGIPAASVATPVIMPQGRPVDAVSRP